MRKGDILNHNLLITGASGFVGSHLVDQLDYKRFKVIQTLRKGQGGSETANSSYHIIGDINEKTDWSSALKKIDIVIHLAARAHMMNDTSQDPLAEFRKVNTSGTVHLANQAVAAGVKRFIFLSTVKVNGESTDNSPFHPDDPPNPNDPYAISKLEAENRLIKLGQESGMEIVIIRPPLVYGPGVKGNFARLLSFVKKELPLPLGNTGNKRSLVYVKNLCSFIETCITNKEAANQIFLVSDGNDISTTELLRQIAFAFGKESRLFPFPRFMIKWIAKLLGRSNEYQRLFGSLQLNIEKNKNLLGWTPPKSSQEGILETVNAYK